jgi:hypothetical protein
MQTSDGSSGSTPEHEQPAVRLPVDALVDGGCRNTDPEHVMRLREHVDNLPAITVDESTLKVVDGSHRLAAMRACGCTDVEVVYIETVDEADLIRQAVRINDAIDRRTLTAHDRREAIRRLLEVDPAISNRALAEACGLPESTARLHRRRLVSAGEVRDAPTRRGRDGKTYPASRPIRGKPTLGAWLAAMLRRIGVAVRAVVRPGR